MRSVGQGIRLINLTSHQLAEVISANGAMCTLVVADSRIVVNGLTYRFDYVQVIGSVWIRKLSPDWTDGK